MSICILTAQAHTKRLSLWEDLVEILVGSSLRGPCMQILQMPCLRVACMTALLGGSWEVLVSRSCKIRSSSSSRSFCDHFMKFSYRSWHEDLATSPCEKLLTWKGPGEIPPVSLHDMAHGLVWRSCWNPPQEVLALRSWRSSALVLGAHRKFLYEDHVSSSL